MGAARRLCVRAVALTGMISGIVSLALPACQFPDYGIASGGVGSGGTAVGGVSGDAGAAAGPGEEGGASGASGASGAAGSDDGGTGGTAPAPVPCPVESCVPKAPTDWQGPVALWDDVAGSLNPLPSCPEGYAKPADLHHGINQPMDGCKCSCAAKGQSCSTNTTLFLYEDQKCEAMPPCATVSAPSSLMCNAVSGCIHSGGSMKAGIPTPSGGSCEPAVSAKAPASWQYDSRVCEATFANLCEDRRQVCAPRPTSPYSSKLCVMNVFGEGDPLPACPAEYPSRKVLNRSFADNRQCSACTCSGLSGGSCMGKLTLSAEADCSGDFEYKLGDGCVPFALVGNNVRPSSVSAQYDLTPGTCSVTSQSTTTGMASTNGSTTVVCCH